MRKVNTSTTTGSDTQLYYDIGQDSGDAPLTHIRVIHLQEWSDLVGEMEAEDMEKYNVVCHDVCIFGYDAFKAPETHGVRIGESVHDSLRSCGFELKHVGLDVFRIEHTYDGAIIAQGALTDRTMALVIAECMYGYGAGTRVHDESGNNARTLLRSARAA